MRPRSVIRKINTEKWSEWGARSNVELAVILDYTGVADERAGRFWIVRKFRER